MLQLQPPDQLVVTAVLLILIKSLNIFSLNIKTKQLIYIYFTDFTKYFSSCTYAFFLWWILWVNGRILCGSIPFIHEKLLFRSLWFLPSTFDSTGIHEWCETFVIFTVNVCGRDGIYLKYIGDISVILVSIFISKS